MFAKKLIEIGTAQVTAPVLFLIFNRPDTTARVFKAVRQARPAHLYIAADGPRDNRPGERERCGQARAIVTGVDWPCEVRTLFRQRNLGCREAVSSAITWFFENEEEGIILEDDCLPHPSFFPYCSELLERYRDNERVMCITGENGFAFEFPGRDSYLFSRFPLIWGWATWRRAWRHYDFGSFRVADRLPIIKAVSKKPEFVAFWRHSFQAAIDGDDIWDYVWNYCMWANNGLCCVPRRNLTSNIGFGEDATHTFALHSPRANQETFEMAFPLEHPSLAIPNDEYDQVAPLNIHGIQKPPPLVARAMRKAKRVLAGVFANPS